jgi:serine/threonine-protein kinase
LVDLPVPDSPSAEARAAYTSGLQAVRDASIIAAVQQFARASELDPMMAAAHLRAHIHGLHMTESEGHFQKALDLRARLDARDQALLDALVPAFSWRPPSFAETGRRLDALAAASPRDLEIAFIAATFEGDVQKRAARLEAVAALDPHFAAPVWYMANDLFDTDADDRAATRAMAERCIERAPSASCHNILVYIDDDEGRCAEMEAAAQQAIAIAGPNWRAYDVLARAVYANGAKLDAARAALEQKWSVAPAATAEWTRLADEAQVAILTGDFATAEDRLLEFQKLEASDAHESEHERPTWGLVDLYEETGREARAAQVADEYLRKRAGWQPMGSWSPRPLFFAAAARGGLRTEAERHADLDAWLREWKTDPAYLPQRWIHGYAFPARTKDDAVAALAAAPDPVPRVAYHSSRRAGLDAVGRVYVLAGRAADGLPSLRAAAASCSALGAAIDHTHAELELGQALEATGDTAGACTAYGVVLARWGSAKPPSVSADIARARSRALPCGSGNDHGEARAGNR